MATTTYRPDLITVFKSGLGAVTTVTYSPMDRALYKCLAATTYAWCNNQPFYTKGSSAGYPTQDTENTTYLVAEVDTPNYSGSGASYGSTPVTTTYSYGGAQTEVDGRGFLGFSSVVSTNSASNLPATGAQISSDFVRHKVFYNMQWPLTGYASSTYETYDDVFVPLQYSLYTYCYKGSGCPSEGAGISQVVLSEADEYANELGSGNPLPTETTTYSGYDYFGDPKNILVSTSSGGTADGYSQSVTNTFANDDTNWILGQLKQSVVTANAPAPIASVTRTTNYNYYAATSNWPGFLQSKVVEPTLDNSQHRLVGTYSYDNFGNTGGITISGYGVPARTTSVLYEPSLARFPATVTDPVGVSRTLAFDERFGGMTADVDGNNQQTLWSYDGFGRRITQTKADSTVSKWSYVGGAGCPNSCSVTETTTNGTTTVAPTVTSIYDLLERPTSSQQTSFDGNDTIVQSETTYNALGEAQAISLPYLQNSGSPQLTTYLYDGIGRQISETHPDGSAIASAYDAFLTLPFTTTTVTGPLVPDGTVTAPGQSTPIGESTRVFENSQGEVILVSDALGQSQSYTYDPFGNMLSAKDPAGNISTMTYDVRGHMTERNDPDLGHWIYNTLDAAGNNTMDALGEVKLQTDAIGQTTASTYDLLGRVTQRTETPIDPTLFTIVSNWAYGTAATNCSTTHSRGQLVTSTNNDSLGYERDEFYDGKARPSKTSITLAQGFGGTAFNTTTVYDPASRVKTITDPSGFKRTYDYNPQGYPCQIDSGSNANTWTTNCSGGGAAIWTVNNRDAMLHSLSQTFGNGLTTIQSFYPTTGRLNTIQTGPTAAPTQTQRLYYSWDGVGNLHRRWDQKNGTSEFLTYDALNRLSQSVVNASTTPITKTLTYDAAGNIKNKSDVGDYTYGAGAAGPHAVTSIAGTVNNGSGSASSSITNPNYWYDKNGNMITGGGRRLTYSVFNVPNCISTGGATCANSTNAMSFSFDPEHRRTIQSISSGSTITEYFNAGGVQTELYTTTGPTTVWRSYLMADGEAIGMATTPYPSGTSKITYFHTDHLGSVVALTDDTGALKEQQAYDAWGKRRCVTLDGTICTVAGADDPSDKLTSAVTRGFTDQEHLLGNGLIHMNGRIYDPQIGKFTSADPRVPNPFSTQGWNLYAYTENNPLNATDPSGFDSGPASMWLTHEKMIQFKQRLSDIDNKTHQAKWEMAPAPPLPAVNPGSTKVALPKTVDFTRPSAPAGSAQAAAPAAQPPTTKPDQPAPPAPPPPPQPPQPPPNKPLMADPIADAGSDAQRDAPPNIPAPIFNFSTVLPTGSLQGQSQQATTVNDEAGLARGNLPHGNQILDTFYGRIHGNGLAGVAIAQGFMQGMEGVAPALECGIRTCGMEETIELMVESTPVGLEERFALGAAERAFERSLGKSLLEEIGCGCFVAGTLVETDHGLIPIEKIKVGDRVRSRDEKTGKTAYKRVAALLGPHDREIYAVQFKLVGAGLTEAFEVTDDHPWMSKDGHWVTTLQLKIGNELRTEGGGRRQRVVLPGYRSHGRHLQSRGRRLAYVLRRQRTYLGA